MGSGVCGIREACGLTLSLTHPTPHSVWLLGGQRVIATLLQHQPLEQICFARLSRRWRAGPRSFLGWFNTSGLAVVRHAPWYYQDHQSCLGINCCASIMTETFLPFPVVLLVPLKISRSDRLYMFAQS